MKKKLLDYLDKEFKLNSELIKEQAELGFDISYYQGQMDLIDDIQRFICDNPY